VGGCVGGWAVVISIRGILGLSSSFPFSPSPLSPSPLSSHLSGRNLTINNQRVTKLRVTQRILLASHNPQRLPRSRLNPGLLRLILAYISPVLAGRARRREHTVPAIIRALEAIVHIEVRLRAVPAHGVEGD
jgi:hypothetical protein